MARARRSDETVRVAGLDAFRRELRKLEADAGPDGLAMLKEANHKVASMVVGKAQSRASSLGAMQAKAASSLRAGRQQARAVVSGGGARTPFFWGAEFGALQYKQFLTWKKPGNGNTGYFLFPTMKAETQNIIELYAKELDKIAKDAFPD
jgi:hypothetical protein